MHSDTRYTRPTLASWQIAGVPHIRDVVRGAVTHKDLSWRPPPTPLQRPCLGVVPPRLRLRVRVRLPHDVRNVPQATHREARRGGHTLRGQRLRPRQLPRLNLCVEGWSERRRRLQWRRQRDSGSCGDSGNDAGQPRASTALTMIGPRAVLPALRHTAAAAGGRERPCASGRGAHPTGARTRSGECAAPRRTQAQPQSREERVRKREAAHERCGRRRCAMLWPPQLRLHG